MILVTGASGFLGQHLLEALSKKGEAVRAIYRNHRPENLRFQNVTWEAADLLDTAEVEEMLQGIDRLYHCAATVSFDPKDKNKLVRENVAITENIVNGVLSSNVEKLVHVSSIAALGRQANSANKLISEKDIFEEGKDNSQYALGKYLGEMAVWRGMAEGLNAVIVNPAIILGAGDWNKGSAKLMRVCDEEFPWYTKGMTGWVDVRDVVQAMMLLMDSNIANERFILSTGNYYYKDIFTKMAVAIGKKPPHKFAGKWLTGLVWRLAFLKSKLTGTEATITRETARTAQQIYRFDNSKFLKAFPEFQFRSIEETIQDMAQAFIKAKTQ